MLDSCILICFIHVRRRLRGYFGNVLYFRFMLNGIVLTIPKYRLWKDYGYIMEGLLTDYGRIMERLWNDYGKIIEWLWNDYRRIIQGQPLYQTYHRPYVIQDFYPMKNILMNMNNGCFKVRPSLTGNSLMAEHKQQAQCKQFSFIIMLALWITASWPTS